MYPKCVQTWSTGFNFACFYSYFVTGAPVIAVFMEHRYDECLAGKCDSPFSAKLRNLVPRAIYRMTWNSTKFIGL